VVAAVQVTLLMLQKLYIKKEIEHCKYREECSKLIGVIVSILAFAGLSI